MVSRSIRWTFWLKNKSRRKEEGLFEKLDEKICIGQGYRGKTGVLGVGHCTCKFQNYVEGCPPLERDIYEFLKGYIGERTPGK
jgi:hypothetical protein